MTPRFLFVTNFCPHYRVRTFEVMAERADVRFVFFSAGNEWYWEQRHGRQQGRFPHEYLRGFHVLPKVRITPRLIPIVWRYDGDVILKCITGRFALPVTLLIAKLRRKPFVLWTGMWQHPRTVFHLLSYPITRLVYAASDAIVVYGEHVKRYLVAVGVDRRKVFVAPHAVDNEVYGRPVRDGEREDVRRLYGLGARRVILYVGRLERQKGIEDLLTAFARLAAPECVLLLAGEGSQSGPLRNAADRLGIADRVVFAGYVAKEKTVALYAVSDVFVLPSVSVREGRETWGLVVNEAMNQGVPVIATTAVGAAAGGLVSHGVNGEVVPERDPDGLCRALDRLLRDEAYRQRLSAEALAMVRQWDNRGMTDGFLEAVRYAFERG